MARQWGFWTKGKLDILRQYLAAFSTATKGVPSRVYLDLFGGEPENEDRITGTLIDGSARIALQTTDPPFTHLRFFELPHNARKLEQALGQEFPGRNVRVYAGDSNDTVDLALRALHVDGVAWAPSFAFIDPNGPHFHWLTLSKLAQHKPSRVRTKVELWLLFPAPLFARMLPATAERSIRPVDEDAISRMFGTQDWHAIYQAKLEGTISPGEARAEYVNLIRWRLEDVLGYKWTHQLDVHNEHDRPLYQMIFATDSEPGHKIMGYLYNRAASSFPQMRQQARSQRAQLAFEAEGQFSLFGDLGIAEVTSAASRGAQEQLYVHELPEQPREHYSEHCPHCH
jgi:three-Cys-motif partner protein